MADPELVADYSYARPAPAAIKAAGYGGVVRYLSMDPAKNLTASELTALHAAGLAVALVWEAGSTDMLAGAAEGAFESGVANRLADALGWPISRPIFYAADFAVPGGQLAAVEGYLKACVGRPRGLYGGIDTVDAALASRVVSWGWQTSAWSQGRVSKLAQLYQRQTPTRTIAGAAAGDWDENVALAADWGGWSLTPDSPPKPAPAPAKPYPLGATMQAIPFHVTLDAAGWQATAVPVPAGAGAAQVVNVVMDWAAGQDPQGWQRADASVDYEQPAAGQVRVVINGPPGGFFTGRVFVAV